MALMPDLETRMGMNYFMVFKKDVAETINHYSNCYSSWHGKAQYLTVSYLCIINYRNFHELFKKGSLKDVCEAVNNFTISE
jgi:hypothetical protein